MAIVNFPSEPSSITNISSDSIYSESFYTANGLKSPLWLFSVNAFPVIPITPDHSYETMLPWDFDGITRITNTQSVTPETYTVNDWKSPPWLLSDNSTPTLPIIINYSYETLLPWNMEEREIGITEISLEEARQQTTYETADWEFGTIWAIQNGESYPWFIRPGEPESIIGDPLSSSKFNVFVVKDRVNGTMYFNGETYRSLGWSERIDTTEGTVGDTVTYTYDGETVRARNGKTYPFIASGIQDPTAPGNFSQYTTDTERTVSLLEDRSNHVNFYYIVPVEDALAYENIPEFHHLMGVKTLDRIVFIALSNEPVSDVKVQMPEGNAACAVLVPVGSQFASPIHVNTADGVMAICEIPV